MNLNAAASKAGGNRNRDTLRTHRQCQLMRTGSLARKPNPVTESQADLIAHLRKCLDDAGIDNSFIVEPETSKVASHVINALMRMANSHGINTRRENNVREKAI